MIIIEPYKLGSKSAKLLQAKLQSMGQRTLRVRRGSKPRAGVLIKWGQGSLTKKDVAFDKFQSAGISIPSFTRDINVARTWDGEIVARTLLNSSGGKGIVYCTKDTLVRAPLYTKFIEKDAEYRVHIFNGECIDYAKKIIRGTDHPTADWYFLRGVKNLDENIELAKRAVIALGLNFGAVDIIRKDKKSYVLEVNTAPGMMGEITSTAYASAIIKSCH